MDGLLIYLMGPSGAGKDSLIAALRRSRAAERENLLIAHRYITRPANARDSEQHIPLSEREFQARRRHGLVALDWRAHGCHYAVGVEMEAWMSKGFTVILNGSRQHLPTAKQKYADRLKPVCLTVSTETLKKRLAARNRENAEQIENRLRRALAYQDGLPDDCLYLCNEGDIADTTRHFLRLFRALSAVRGEGANRGGIKAEFRAGTPPIEPRPRENPNGRYPLTASLSPLDPCQ
jgi:ribose 1,5-bisphosphokinase